MNYIYKSAKVLPTGPGAQWKTADLRNEIVYGIFLNYKEIVLTLDRDGEEIFVDLNQLRTQYASYANTLAVLLQAIGNLGLDTLPELPGEVFHYATYSDAVRVGYSFKLDKAGYALPDNYPASDKTDLKLSRQKYNTDLSLLHSHCLLSVNGFYHMTDTDGTNAWVMDGGKSAMKKTFSHVGIWNFHKVGRLSKIKLVADDIVPTTENGLEEGLSFTVDADLENKSYFLILGGYLVLPEEDVFWQSGDKRFHLNLKYIPYLERLLESADYIDLSPLQLTSTELSATNMNVEEVHSDAVIKRYLTLSQSFLVVIDRKDVFWQKHFIRHSGMPGLLIAYREPVYPLFVGYGRTAEYWKVLESGQWAVTVEDSWVRNYTFRLQDKNGLTNVTDQIPAQNPHYYSQGLLLEMGAVEP